MHCIMVDPCETQKKCTVTRVVMHPSYGNALRYSLSMFVEFENMRYPSLIPISARFHRPSHLLLSMRSSPNSTSINVQI